MKAALQLPQSEPLGWQSNQAMLSPWHSLSAAPDRPGSKAKLCSKTTWYINRKKKNLKHLFSKIQYITFFPTAVFPFLITALFFPTPRSKLHQKTRYYRHIGSAAAREIAMNISCGNKTPTIALRDAGSVLWAALQLQLKLVFWYQYPMATNNKLLLPSQPVHIHTPLVPPSCPRPNTQGYGLELPRQKNKEDLSE